MKSEGPAPRPGGISGVFMIVSAFAVIVPIESAIGHRTFALRSAITWAFYLHHVAAISAAAVAAERRLAYDPHRCGLRRTLEHSPLAPRPRTAALAPVATRQRACVNGPAGPSDGTYVLCDL
eukprot:2221176-Prymnesium_polylepis.1